MNRFNPKMTFVRKNKHFSSSNSNSFNSIQMELSKKIQACRNNNRIIAPE